MKETQIGSFIELVENAIKEYWDLDALTDYEGATLQYKDVARKIEKLHIIFNEAGIEKGTRLRFAAETVRNGLLLFWQFSHTEL